MTGQEPLTQPGKRFVDAVERASDIHRTQGRKNTRVPYLSHQLAVASLVLEDDGDEDEAIAGLLHDADPSAARVMLADKLNNLRSTLTDLAIEGPQVWTRFNAGRDDQCWYYGALAEAARANHGNSRLTRDFVAAVERLANSGRIPRNPSDWTDTAEVSHSCLAPDGNGANPCGRPAGHRGLHARSPRPGDL